MFRGKPKFYLATMQDKTLSANDLQVGVFTFGIIFLGKRLAKNCLLHICANYP